VAEQLFRKQQVVGSNPTTGSTPYRLGGKAMQTQGAGVSVPELPRHHSRLHLPNAAQK
jgi:hypothetical protein